MAIPLSSRSKQTRSRIFSALRALSLRDEATARAGRRIEHDINEAMFLIEAHGQEKSFSLTLANRVAARWLQIAQLSVDVDPELSDLVACLARHWLVRRIDPPDAAAWVARAEACVWALSRRNESMTVARRRRVEDAHQPMVTLVLRGLPKTVQPVEVEVDLCDGSTIGRAPECDWVLPGETVSRHHARLRYDEQRRAFMLRDLSRNGIALENGEILIDREVEISVGSTLKIPKEGHYTIIVQSIFVPMLISPRVFEAGGDTAFSDIIELDEMPEVPSAPADDPKFLGQLHEHYPFLDEEGVRAMCRYILGGGDGYALVERVFADLLPP